MKVQIGTATLYLGDCNVVMKRFKENHFDLAIVDPPYFDGPNKKGYFGKGYSSLGVKRANYYQLIDSWKLPDKAYFKKLKHISRNQIIWGANHFCNAFDASSAGWIVWDKINGNSSFADAELAYSSFDKAVRTFRYMWNGMHQGRFGGTQAHKEKRIHPTQKPVVLYEWLLGNYAKSGDVILDTHLGSGSSAIAAINMGLEFVGIEMDENYFNLAVDRIRKSQEQNSLFERAHIALPTQEVLL